MMELHRKRFKEFIPYDPDKKQDMEEKVQRYLDLMEDEDEDTVMNNDRQLLKNIQAKEKDFNFRKKSKNSSTAEISGQQMYQAHLKEAYFNRKHFANRKRAGVGIQGIAIDTGTADIAAGK